ncbi:hypothetical protein PHJA_001436900 [Phtheirospermum japonicum]|uniref:Uncharacterized protein n=1 Tax=Phtheirospermum japonicum TaxID=374723 RepID=A0A830C1E1_9LAMI|nr:hypothetical protein PHJA_001436900 [Phtheirospermum japonicum]
MATIFALSLLFLDHAQISEFLFADTLHNHEVPDTFSFVHIAFWLFKAVYILFFLVLSLLSTSSVVLHDQRDHVYRSHECCAKGLERVMATLAWSFIIVLVYNMVSFLILVPWIGSDIGPSTTRPAMDWGPLFVIIYMMGFVFTSIIWHLATAVSVLEEECGIEP